MGIHFDEGVYGFLKFKVYVKMSDDEKRCRAICISSDERCTRGVIMGEFCITHYRIFSRKNVSKHWFKWRKE